MKDRSDFACRVVVIEKVFFFFFSVSVAGGSEEKLRLFYRSRTYGLLAPVAEATEVLWELRPLN